MDLITIIVTPIALLLPVLTLLVVVKAFDHQSASKALFPLLSILFFEILASLAGVFLAS